MTARADFWSRRKAAVKAEAAADTARVRAAAAEANSRAAPDNAACDPGASDAEILKGLGLRDPDALKMGDDFSCYLTRAVPEHLRRRALRRLWSSNPVLANLDGLNDYDDDFTAAGSVTEAIRAVYRLGRNAAERLDDGHGQSTHDQSTAPEAPVSEAAEDAMPDPVVAAPPPPEPAPAPAGSRHMRFSFPQRARA